MNEKELHKAFMLKIGKQIVSNTIINGQPVNGEEVTVYQVICPECNEALSEPFRAPNIVKAIECFNFNIKCCPHCGQTLDNIEEVIIIE